VRFGKLAIVRRFAAVFCAFLMFRLAAAVCFFVAIVCVTPSAM
jgi:hypothetical protein